MLGALLWCWSVPAAEPSARPPASGDELRYWLDNMFTYHRFSVAEARASTGLSENEIDAALRKFGIPGGARSKRKPGEKLLVLPYPGARHPRIGFLEGAVDPQRETKVSIFTPWDENSYVVADLPEALWSNLGLTYLAHTHVPTLWTKQNVSLPRLEWNRNLDGTYDFERRLPNGIVFGTRVVPTTNAVRMEMWLKNGTANTLRDLRVQNCVMLKGARGFTAQTNANKILAKPYAACRSAEGTRWVITAWEACERAWANAPVPCLHSDPRFPDCPAGETRRLRGWISFYEGDDVEGEFRRIDRETGFR